MSWLLSDDQQLKAIKEIEQTGSDRATAIVGGAFIETDLQNAIEARLRQGQDGLITKLFKPTGPLGPFGTKIDLGFLLGIYEKAEHDDLTAISWIRNQFAHRREPMQFDSREIRLKCKDIKIVDKPDYPKLPGPGMPETNRSPPRLPEGASPRDRYIQAVKLFAYVFWAASHDLVMQGKSHVWRERKP